jgi:hypothetical protein
VKTCSQEESVQIIESTLYPKSELGARIRLGMDAQGVKAGESLSNNDERNHFTYGEFPLESFDQLLDSAINHLIKDSAENNSIDGKVLKLVDIGSGCGRLILHAALGRSNFDIHGVEISDIMHDYACDMVQRGADHNLFGVTSDDDIHTSDASKLTLHRAPAQECSQIFSDADIIFAYSSVFPDGGFAIEERAMLMGPSMSSMLAKACKPGCIAVMTDRLLDPEFGWQYQSQLDVVNPDLLGSTGYISILNK